MKEIDIEDMIPNYLVQSQLYSVVVTDLDGCYIYFNNFFKNRFYYISNELIGRPSHLSVHPSDIQICRNASYECLSNPNKTVKIQIRKPGKNLNEYNWTEWEFAAFKNLKNEVIGIICIGHDITESKKAFQDVIVFAKKVDTIIEKVTDGFYQLDVNWRFIKINKFAEGILGIPREQLLGKNIWEIFPQSSCYNFPNYYVEAVSENVSKTFEDYRPDIKKWFSVICYPSNEGLTVFFRDITKEKESQIKLKESEKRLQAILNSTQDSNILVGKNYKILSFNKATQEFSMKVFEKEIKEQDSMLDYLVPSKKASFISDTSKAMKGEVVKKEFEINGFWFESCFFPVYDDCQNIIGFSMNSTDISKKKNDDLRIKQQDLMLRAIYESTTEASTFIDTDYIIRYLNHPAKEITKQLFSKEAKIGEKFMNYILPEYRETTLKTLSSVLNGKRTIKELNQGDHWWQVKMYPVLDEDSNCMGIAHNVQDITERKIKELKILEQNNALNSIAWIQSHELRKPVANILGLCDILKNSEEESETFKVDILEKLVKSTNKLDNIIRKIVLKANT